VSKNKAIMCGFVSVAVFCFAAGFLFGTSTTGKELEKLKESNRKLVQTIRESEESAQRLEEGIRRAYENAGTSTDILERIIITITGIETTLREAGIID